MPESETTQLTPLAVEHLLREELTQDGAALASARPILRHLLVSDEHGLFSDEIVARIRGMLLDVAHQLLEAHAQAAQVADVARFAGERCDGLARRLFANEAFLAHGHALALEAQLLERIRERSGFNPVLSPLLQELAAGSNSAMAALAMNVLAAQARFIQYQLRMQLPLRDLPGELFHHAMIALREAIGDDGAGSAESRLRANYEEGAGRAGLMARLVTAMASRAPRALAIDHAGLSIFATALAMASRQDRDLVVLSLSGGQFARLALSLRAAGLAPVTVAQQFALLHPDTALPDGFELVNADAAANLLTGHSPAAGS